MKRVKHRIIRLGVVFALAWVALVLLPSSRYVRGLLILPLYAKSTDATADVAYVMAGSDALFERMRAATDLYHMRQVKAIYYLGDKQTVGYNFSLARSETAGERAASYMRWFGVPAEVLHEVKPKGPDSWTSSMDEARWFARQVLDRSTESAAETSSIRSVVVVTSAPHSRRSYLCFQRAVGDRIAVKSYPATVVTDGAELYHPIWLEYLKLGYYLMFAHR